MKRFPFYRQFDAMDCGPTCLRMIARYYGRQYSLETLRTLSDTTREGSSLLSMSKAAEKIGFRSVGARIAFEQLADLQMPAMVFWDKKHFVVVYKVRKDKVYVADPGFGLMKYEKDEFIRRWIGNNATESTREGLILLLEPTPDFYDQKVADKQNGHRKGLQFLLSYAAGYGKYFRQLLIGILAASLIQLAFPFLTQNIVDLGIKNRNFNFVFLVLAAQLFLFIGKVTIDIIQNWILVHLSTRINISLVSDFFIKLTGLPIAFFDVKMTGDLMRRIEDHERIDRVLTSGSLNVLFSFFNILVFSLVLWYYDLSILLLFAAGSTLFFGWILVFMRKRKALDHKNFHLLSEEKSKIIELISGMQEIKLHNAETKKRWSWEYIQARLFQLKIKSLALYNKQTSGAQFINEAKNIIITAYAAYLVITGQITLGMMLSISYIIGQLNSPLLTMIDFVYQLQDAKLSLERLQEVHNKAPETSPSAVQLPVPAQGDIILNKVSFKYKGAKDPLFEDLDLVIPRNKITAIVGASGSGKTTLMKLLMKFYPPDKGQISIGRHDLEHIGHQAWRAQLGAVMQDGFIFNDTIAENIVVGENQIDEQRLYESTEIANIRTFIEELALSFNTRIGQDGVGLSGGQKQRILIARAIYKNPDFIFFDEATSALDANNERRITENLNEFFCHKTAVVIAHRLSTVKGADKIVVLDKGRIVEEGVHEELIYNKGPYYHLVKNQLELEKLAGYA
ncbi:MAG: peptidase domain-containing ABC transporter [Saprospiraceae bacterium]|nr:peptidase domain-containing ABC transporter [Lewinella sp.]